QRIRRRPPAERGVAIAFGTGVADDSDREHLEPAVREDVRDRVARLAAAQRDGEQLARDAQCGFRWILFGSELSGRELEQSAEESVHRAPTEQEAAAFAPEERDLPHARCLGLLARRRKAIDVARRARSAMPRDRAHETRGLARKTDRAAEIHHRLVELAP